MRYFYPRSPCGERRTKTALTSTVLNFYPRSPCGERPMTSIYFHGIFYFYPRSPCGERPAHKMGRDWLIDISIHALLAESDIFPSGTAPLVRNFYPRSPCGERPLLSRNTLFDTAISIHALLAESDAFLFGGAQRSGYFYPRSPCGERHCPAVIVRATLEFLSTLSLRRATFPGSHLVRNSQFLSTLSLRRATKVRYPWTPLTSIISIHALLAESDRQCTLYGRVRTNFYPRSPCGERRCFGTCTFTDF